MPRMRYAGRLWNVSSDDWVVPAACNVIFKALCCAAVGVVAYYIYEHNQANVCKYSLLHIYIVGIFGIFFIGLLNDILLGCLSGRGTLNDYKARSCVSCPLTIAGMLGVVELGLVGLGTYVVFETKTACDRDQVDDSQLVKDLLQAVVVTHWVTLLIRLCGICYVCDCRGSMSKQVVMSPDERTRARVRRWTRRCRCLTCCSSMTHTSGNAVFEELGSLLARVFQGPDEMRMTASDMAAGLALVRAVQKQKEDQKVQSRVRLHLEREGAHVRSFSSHAGRVKSDGWRITHQRTSQSELLNTNDMHDAGILTEAAHFSEYALGAYGWPMYSFQHPGTGLCKLVCSCTPCCCCGVAGREVHGDCCRCNQKAFHLQTRVRPKDVLYANWTNHSVGQVAFAAVVDHTRQALVITCRGTLSVNDTITDGLAEEVNIKNDPEGKSLTLPEGHCAAHKGMWMSAKFLAAELRDAGVLRSVQRPSGGGAGEEKAERQKRPLLGRTDGGLRLVIVGHSLGAGVATLLSLLLKTEYPELECYAFSPPGALVSPSLASFMEEWLVSIVLGKDLVPRLSVPALHKLLLHMTELTRHARVSKSSLLLGGCCCCTTRKPVQQLLYKPGSTPDTIGARLIARYQQWQADQEAAAGGNLLAGYHLGLAGRVLHLVKTGTKRRRCCMPCRKKQRLYKAVWADPRDFNTILVSVLSVKDHFPDKVSDVLHQVLYDSLQSGTVSYSKALPNVIHDMV